jgi:hypothetical protein
VNPYTTDLEPTEQGIFEIDEPIYRKLKAVNISNINLVGRSPLHWYTEFTTPSESTKAMDIGTAFHTAVLEPHNWDEKITIEPGDFINRRTAQYQAWKRLNEDRVILTADEANDVECMVEALAAKQAAKQLLAQGWNERSLLWRHHKYGIWCKCRIDWIPADVPNAIVDLKKTRDASKRGFGNSIWKYRYYWQAYWYTLGFATVTGVDHQAMDYYWIAAESEEPYGVNVFYADPVKTMSAGDYVDGYIEDLARCIETGEYHGYTDEIIQLGERFEDYFSDPSQDNIPY